MSSSIEVREGARGAGTFSDQTLLLPGEYERMQRAQVAGGFLLPVGTSWVSRDVHSISEEVARRWPNLRVASCDCGRCLEQGHYPHVVLEQAKDGTTQPVFGFTQFGRHVIERLQMIHVSQHDINERERTNRAMRRAARKKSDDRRAEGLEVIESALKSHKHDWRGPNGLKADPNSRG